MKIFKSKLILIFILLMMPSYVFAVTYDNSYTWADFSLGKNIGKENNIEVCIQTQKDLENYLKRTGNDLTGDRIWLLNSEKLTFPTGTYTMNNKTDFYFPSSEYYIGQLPSTCSNITTVKNFGNIDFHNSTFVIAGEGFLKLVFLGDQRTSGNGKRALSNLTVYGNTSSEYQEDNDGIPVITTTQGTGFGFFASIVNASNLLFTNMEFNNAQRANVHLFDVTGHDIEFQNITNRGYLENWTEEQMKKIKQYPGNNLRHYIYSEIIQLQHLDGTAGMGSSNMLSPTFKKICQDLWKKLDDENITAPTVNITISNLRSTGYSGLNGPSIVKGPGTNGTYSTVYKPYASSLGNHGYGQDANANPYKKIVIQNSYFENVAANGENLRLYAPIHFRILSKNLYYSSDSNSLYQQCLKKDAAGIKECIENDPIWKITDITLRNNTFVNSDYRYTDADKIANKKASICNSRIIYRDCDILAGFDPVERNITKVILKDENGNTLKTYTGYYPEEGILGLKNEYKGTFYIFVSSSYDNNTKILTRNYRKAKETTYNINRNLDEKGNELSSTTGYTLAEKKVVTTQEELVNKDKIIVKHTDYIYTFKINDYDVDNTNNFLKNIKLNTNLSTYKNHFALPEGYTLSISLGNKKNIYTGSKVKIYLNNEELKTYTNIVKGDLNGDGETNSGDLLQIRKHLIGTNPLKGVYFTAGDINNDSVLNSGDLLRVRQHLLGIKKIS